MFSFHATHYFDVCGADRKSPVQLLLSKKENRPGATSGAVPLWNEDKMKKMKLSLAGIMVTKSCYTKNLKVVTEVLS